MPRVRSIFLSDVHLGTPACQAGALLEFLKAYESEHLFLVGDIVDFWAIQRRGVYWSTEQNTVVQKILKRARQEVSVVFVPGNHDEAAREHAGASFGNIRVERDYLHVAADGRRYLLIHGDEFDQVTKYHRWLAILGDHAYALLVRANRWLSWLRRTLKLPGYWSLAGYAKHRVKRAVSFIFDFEDSVLRHARERGVDGVICGHIHSAVIRDQGGIAYLNCGDWVDSCTAIVEHPCGAMELVHWSGMPCAADSSSSVPTGGTPHDHHEKSACCNHGAGHNRHDRLGAATISAIAIDRARAGDLACAGRDAPAARDLA
jgi:UDP-2,3-diacylglucosamine pyrophosphatase LpxH